MGLELYRMLWGYSAEDVADGVMNKLVEYLNNDEWLDFRVLAFQNLHDITGKMLVVQARSVRRGTPAGLSELERKNQRIEARAGEADASARTEHRDGDEPRQIAPYFGPGVSSRVGSCAAGAAVPGSGQRRPTVPRPAAAAQLCR